MTWASRARLLVTLTASVATMSPAVAADNAVVLPVPDAPSAVIARPDFAHSPTLPTPQTQGPSQASPQSPPDSAFKRGLKRGLHDQRQIYSAPFHHSALKWDITFAAITAGLIASDKYVSDALPQDHLNVSREISNAGLIATVGTVGGMWISSLATDDPHTRESGILGFEALANTASVYIVGQLVAGRERPLQGDGEGHFWKNNSLNSSFPSGHAAFSWTAASVIAHEYPRPWVQWLAYGTATAVSITRVTGQKHFPSDVVVGGTVGYLIGRHIFHAHCHAGLSPVCSKSPQPEANK